jgi:hypothetical protein
LTDFHLEPPRDFLIEGLTAVEPFGPKALLLVGAKPEL